MTATGRCPREPTGWCSATVGEVIEAPAGTGLCPGDLISGVGRRPDPEHCAACAAGGWDMCRNGGYAERGISGAAGYGSQLWRVDADYAVKIDPALGDLGVLLESTSVVAKAWANIDRISAGLPYAPEVAVVTGAGPVGSSSAPSTPAADTATRRPTPWPGPTLAGWRACSHGRYQCRPGPRR